MDSTRALSEFEWPCLERTGMVQSRVQADPFMIQGGSEKGPTWFLDGPERATNVPGRIQEKTNMVPQGIR